MRGQASVEYVAAITLLALVLAGAGVVAAAPDLPGAVVRELRTALCIVGGDVCRAQDAAARGLEPCLVGSESHETETGVSVLFVRAGGTDFWTVGRRSDGRVTLTEGYGQDLGASTGIGAELGPVAVTGSVEGGGGFRSGRSWVVTEERLRALLEQTDGDVTAARLMLPILLGPPAEEFLEGGGSAGTQLAVEAVREIPGAGADARAVLGRRTGPEGTSYYVDLGAGSAGPIADAVPGLDLHGRAVAEYRASDPPLLTLRTVGRDHSGDEVETVLRLPLRDGGDAAAARRVAFVALGDPAAAMRDLITRVRARGTMERLRYRTVSEDSSWAYGLSLGVKLGADRRTQVLRRELVDAQVLGGPLPATREDCLQFAKDASDAVGGPR